MAAPSIIGSLGSVFADAISGIAPIAGAVLAVAAALIGVYVMSSSVRRMVAAVRDECEARATERKFRERYAREQRRERYRGWRAAQKELEEARDPLAKFVGHKWGPFPGDEDRGGGCRVPD